MSKQYGALQDKNNNTILPIGLETITNSNGTALKFADGTLICTKVVIYNGPCNTAWGNWYDTSNISLGDYAITFISKPCVYVTVTGSSAGLVEGVYGTTNTAFGGMWICRATAFESVTYNINCVAIGRWR